MARINLLPWRALLREKRRKRFLMVLAVLSVGFFKKVGGSRFAKLDTYFYSPLCLVLGVGLLVVAWG